MRVDVQQSLTSVSSSSLGIGEGTQVSFFTVSLYFVSDMLTFESLATGKLRRSLLKDLVSLLW